MFEGVSTPCFLAYESTPCSTTRLSLAFRRGLRFGFTSSSTLSRPQSSKLENWKSNEASKTSKRTTRMESKAMQSYSKTSHFIKTFKSLKFYKEVSSSLSRPSSFFISSWGTIRCRPFGEAMEGPKAPFGAEIFLEEQGITWYSLLWALGNESEFKLPANHQTHLSNTKTLKAPTKIRYVTLCVCFFWNVQCTNNQGLLRVKHSKTMENHWQQETVVSAHCRTLLQTNQQILHH